jgi:hypothetical protein
MTLTKTLAPLVLAGGFFLGSATSAQGVGSPMPEVELKDYSQTGAGEWGDFAGRAVLVEFFAYW